MPERKKFKFSPIPLMSGTVSGIVQSFSLLWYDKALYLSVMERRPFLHPANFHKPFKGITQSIGHRILASALYFPLEDLFSRTLPDMKGHTFVVGLCAGSVNGAILNPISAIRYRFWTCHSEAWTPSNMHPQTFLETAKEMIGKGSRLACFSFLTFSLSLSGGRTALLRGGVTTMVRDVVFGGVFSSTRWYLKDAAAERSPEGKLAMSTSVAIDMLAASFATTLSAPWNYARNVKYYIPPNEAAPPFYSILRSLWEEALVITNKELAASACPSQPKQEVEELASMTTPKRRFTFASFSSPASINFAFLSDPSSLQ